MSKQYLQSRTVRRSGSKKRTCSLCNKPVRHWRWDKHTKRHELRALKIITG